MSQNSIFEVPETPGYNIIQKPAFAVMVWHNQASKINVLREQVLGENILTMLNICPANQ